MPDYRTMFDREYLGAWDLDGKEVTVTVAKVEQGTLVSDGNKKTKKPVMSFEGKALKMTMNKTNCKTMQAMFGPKVENWIGKQIVIFGTTTNFGRQKHDCIRIKNRSETEQ